MLKDYLAENKLSMYKVSKEGSIPYSTLNDLVNGRVEIENCKVILLIQLAEYLNMSLDELLGVIKGTSAAGPAKKTAPAPEIPTSVKPAETAAAVPAGEPEAPQNNEKAPVETPPVPAQEKAAPGTAAQYADTTPEAPAPSAAQQLEEAIHNRLKPGGYIAQAAENKESLLQLMITHDRAEDDSDFDHLRRICKKGGMAEDVFKKGLAYIIMTDYVMAQQDRSLSNVFIEKAPDGKLVRFVLPEPTGNVLFLEKSPKGNDVANLDVAFLKKKERKLLKLVADKSIIDKDRLPSKEALEKSLEKFDLPAKRIRKICSWYDERLSTFLIWLDE